MNAIFTAVMLSSAILLIITSPSQFLPALLGGAHNALTCAVTLLAIYALWMGLSAVAEEAKLTHGVAKLLTPVCKRLFKTKDENILKDLSMNVSCNLLGIGGASTPYGVKAINGLEKEGNVFAQNLLFIINATSIQLIPTTVITLRTSLGSSSAYDIALPSLIATAISTFTGVGVYLLVCTVSKRRKLKKVCST